MCLKMALLALMTGVGGGVSRVVGSLEAVKVTGDGVDVEVTGDCVDVEVTGDVVAEMVEIVGGCWMSDRVVSSISSSVSQPGIRPACWRITSSNQSKLDSGLSASIT